MSSILKRFILPVLALLGLTPAFGSWNYSILTEFLWDYAPYAGPAVYHGGSTWRVVVIEHGGYRYRYEGDGISWGEVGDLFDTPTYYVFAIDSDGGSFWAIYSDGNRMMLYNGSSSYDTGITWDIDNYHDFCPLYNYPSAFAFESYGTLYTAYVSGNDVETYAEWDGCDGDVSHVYWPDLGVFVFGRFGVYYRLIEVGVGSTDYYIGAGSEAEGWVTEDGTVYIAYVNANHELHVITDTVSDEPVDEYLATDQYNINHPQLFADADGPIVATDIMFYYKNCQGDWYGEQYKSWDNLEEASCVFRQDGKIFIIGRKGLSEYSWGMVSFYNDWHSDAPVVNLQGRATDDGVLASWVEEAGLAGSSWTLERDGEELASLSGDAEYRYLDRNLPGPGVYRYSLSVTPPGGDSFRVGPVEVRVDGDVLARPVLNAPYPDPAGAVVTLEYALPADCTAARLAVYDLAGRRISVLNLEPGGHAVEVDCSGYAPGVYTAVLEASGEKVTRRLVIAR
ncbi:MAG TPA: T9SS type A sorting domain-containing protein [bacterium]|nr:T9SS type A sorting domain-containing protein [bacterium]